MMVSGANADCLISALSCSLSAVATERDSGEKVLNELQQQSSFGA
jgi:hypothetical protein